MVGLTWAAAARGEAAPEPKVALPLMLRVVTYDANFGKRGDGEFVILVPSEPEQANAREQFLTLARALKLGSVKERSLRFVGGDFKDTASLSALVQDSRASAVLALAGLARASVEDIAQVAQDRRLYSLALDPAMVAEGICLGIASKDSNPQVVVNVKTANAIDAHYAASVLKLARLVQAGAATATAPAGRVQFEAGMTAPTFISGPDPEYTQRAIDHEVEGTVEAKCVITVEGGVRECRIVRGVPFMDQAVIDALEHRKYTPALLQGKPVEVEFPFKIQLKLGQ